MMVESQAFNQINPRPFKGWGWILWVVPCALLILFAPLPVPAPNPTDRHIRIEASMFQFTPGELKINSGDRVTVELVSTDVVHGFSLDGYAFELKAEPGQTTIGTFTANKSGVFNYRCSVACGNLHPFMIGKIQVGPNLLLARGMVLGLLGVIVALWISRNTISVRRHPNP